MKLDLKSFLIGALSVVCIVLLTGSKEPPTPVLDENYIISRILFCIDGSSVGDERLSTYCNN